MRWFGQIEKATGQRDQDDGIAALEPRCRVCSSKSVRNTDGNTSCELLDKLLVLLLASVCLHCDVEARAQMAPGVASGRGKTSSSSSLEQLSSSLQAIARQVEPSVVQIVSSSLSIDSDSVRSGGAVATQQRSSISGLRVSLPEHDNAIARLGILALTLDEKLLPLLPALRVQHGVLVAAKMANSGAHFGGELSAGDVIYALNGNPIQDRASLVAALELVTTDSPVVLQVERAGRLLSVVFESE